MNKNEKLILKLEIMKKAFESKTPSKILEEYQNKYPEVLDKTIVEMKKEKGLKK